MISVNAEEYNTINTHALILKGRGKEVENNNDCYKIDGLLNR